MTKPAASGSAKGAKRWSRHIGLLIGLAGLGFVVNELVRNWGDVAGAWRGADGLLLLLALLVGTLGLSVIGLGWRECLAALGARRPVIDTLYRYFVGELGKYVPGGVWAVLGRGEMARRAGIPGSVSYASTMLSLAMAYLAAVIVALLSVGLGGIPGENGWWPWMVLVAAVGLFALRPRVVGLVLGLTSKLLRRDLQLPVPSWGQSLRLLAVHIPAWVAIGGATWIIAVTLDPARPDLANITFATAVSWIAGLLAVPVPGGIGVREAVFVAAAASLDTTGVAAAVAITARVCFIVVDVAGAAVFSAALRTRTTRA